MSDVMEPVKIKSVRLEFYNATNQYDALVAAAIVQNARYSSGVGNARYLLNNQTEYGVMYWTYHEHHDARAVLQLCKDKFADVSAVLEQPDKSEATIRFDVPSVLKKAGLRSTAPETM